MKPQLYTVVAVLFLLFCTWQVHGEGHPNAPGNLQLHVNSPNLIAGSYAKDGTSVLFSARPSALTLIANHQPLLSFIHYGAFMKVQLAEAVFLIATSDDTVHGVIDISSIAKNVVLPNIDTSIVHGPEENLDVFNALVTQHSAQELAQAEARMISLVGNLIHQPEAALIPYLSVKLASAGISSISHPSALSIHLPGSRIAKMRDDIHCDPSLLEEINHSYNASVPSLLDGQSSREVRQTCQLMNRCGNACLGLCGSGCDCWSWVCGGCGCFLGCLQHDCCCSCQGTFTRCCLNVFALRCDGFNNSCLSTLG